ncbi:hypothetical protein CWB69_20820, partial [Pseudoalteromonas sp. S980]
SFRVSFTARDAGSDLKKVVIEKDGRPVRTCNNSGTESLTCSKQYSKNSLNYGEHTWTATATDRFGNQSSNTAKVTIIEENS